MRLFLLLAVGFAHLCYGESLPVVCNGQNAQATAVKYIKKQQKREYWDLFSDETPNWDEMPGIETLDVSHEPNSNIVCPEAPDYLPNKIKYACSLLNPERHKWAFEVQGIDVFRITYFDKRCPDTDSLLLSIFHLFCGEKEIIIPLNC